MGFCSYILIWYGVVFGILDWISDIIYVSSVTFANGSLHAACVVFILIQPLWYFFLFILYVASHSKIEDNKERFKTMMISPIYAILQYSKILSASTQVHLYFLSRFHISDTYKLMTLENCFKVQIYTEFFLETLPQMIIQATNNNQTSWGGAANFSFAMCIILFIKDVILLTLYVIKRFIDNSTNPLLRPSAEGRLISRIQRDLSLNIKSYLMDPNDEGIDEDGNTSIHQVSKFEDLYALETQINNFPHLMFMLNKNGYTPLDMAINDKEEQKAILLIQKMTKFSHNCSLKFVKKPHRLELKFEKSFTLCILRNNSQLIQSFPSKSVRTAIVSMSQVKDYNKYKQEKAQYQEMITSPFHLACKLSSEEAVRQLVENQDYEINLLLNERSALYELLSTSCYLDFNILNYLMKKKKPCINSGNRLPLNQAILRGNPFIIKSLIEFGKPNPYTRDINGKAAIHNAAAKLDMDTFDMLIKAGSEPMLPDSNGNTILHIMAMGTIKDAEYDFIKQSIEKHRLRLTRNAENKTPLNLIRSYSSHPAALRGQPNYKKKIWEYFEQKMEEDPLFQDSDKNEEIHEAIIRGSLEEVKKALDKFDMKDGKSQPKILQALETRNYEGKSAIMLSIEHERHDITKYIIENYPDVDLDKQGVKDGNTPLHIACLKEDYETAQYIFTRRPRLCLKQNYLGQTSVHIAAQKKCLEILKLFEQFKQECLLIKDQNGENPLFYAAREGDIDVFKWFTGYIDFFKARGEQNYKGQTIEHIVCIQRNLEIVDVIRPRPDTKDYYGNLPIFYSIMHNDVEMIKKYFKKGRDYFNLRNYKHETIFHIAAKFNAVDSLKELIGRSVYIEELVKKDFKGDTPLHTAAKTGNKEILEFYMTACTKNFLELQNDFGFSVKDAILEKIRLLEEHLADQNEEQAFQTSDGKLNSLRQILTFIDKFDMWISEKTWKDKFDTQMEQYYDQIADANLKVFMDTNHDQKNYNTASPLKASKNDDEPHSDKV